MPLDRELLDIEKDLWAGGPDAYRKHLDDDCLVAFPDMSRLMTREEVASQAEEGRWRDARLDKQGIVELSGDAAIITYNCVAGRKSGETYKALVSSGYVKRDGAWKLAFHAQTPLGDKAT